MKVKNMIKKNSAVSEPEVRRGKFVDLPVTLLLDVKSRAIEESRKQGRHVTETDIIQLALEAFLK